jgi:hypothetical protein
MSPKDQISAPPKQKRPGNKLSQTPAWDQIFHDPPGGNNTPTIPNPF